MMTSKEKEEELRLRSDAHQRGFAEGSDHATRVTSCIFGILIVIGIVYMAVVI